MTPLYATFFALHLIAMICWFAGLFYLPRIFVYIVEQPQAAPTLHIMARKLSHYIMIPSVVVTWVCGHVMIHLKPELYHADWLHAKLVLVAGLTLYHISLEYYRRELVAGRCRKSGKFFRFYNEVPSVLLIIIILLAVFKPF